MGWWRDQRGTVRDAPLSKWFLIAAGIVPLVGVLALGWDLGIVMLAFWLENVVVGFYSILRMAIITRLAALFYVPFFSVHYGMFTLVHGIFVVMLFVDAPRPGFTDSILGALRAAAGPLLLVFVSLVISHGVSFVSNFVRGKEWQRPLDAGQLMGAAYKRVIILHLVLVAGAFPILFLGQPIWGLVLLVTLKVTVDLWSHAREHRTVSNGHETP